MPASIELDKELDVARLAAEAGVEMVKSFMKDRSRVTIDLKGPRDLVTAADRASQEEILKVIASRFPDDAILAEESDWNPHLTSGRLWIVDPIDGTTNFAHGFPIFCVSVAFWSGGRPMAGVVIEVNRHEVFSAVRGGGAFLNGDPIHVSGARNLGESVIGTGFPYKDFDGMDSYLDLFKVVLRSSRSVRRPGAGTYDLCSVAAGRFDGFYEFGLQPWDVAAAALIVEEAGGVVTDWKGSGDWLYAGRMVAGNKAIHGALMDLVAKILPRHVTHPAPIRDIREMPS